MKISLFIFIVSISFWTCKTKPEKVGRGFYNDIVEDLVRHKFYGYYLNRDANDAYGKLVDKYRPLYRKAETDEEYLEIHNEFEEEKNLLEGVFFTGKNSACYLENDTKHIEKFKFAANLERVPFYNEFTDYDSCAILEILKTHLSYSLNNVKSRYFRVGKTPKDSCEIGKIALSEPFFNKNKNKGLIFCRFRCGGLCGFEKVYLLEKIGSYWFIKDEEQISIS
ncbi:hypothetical protein GCM10011514_02570 [Emticicia aquatilis]|uniref:Uncharacterized protein n=1 Tax=Emticicia aquatilis TaxID=1537369 RepID=A0A916YET2_9BACT|nr:hypothetical protein [Emticicia aquatilis]GGD42111.1 hypothetical protein GCM10011514_02570 [Emticicia aquatilis]